MSLVTKAGDVIKGIRSLAIHVQFLRQLALAFGFFVGGAAGALIWVKYDAESIREEFRTAFGNKHLGSVPTQEIARFKGASAILTEESTEAGPPTETVHPNGHSENERQGDMNEYEKKWKRVEEEEDEDEDDDFFDEMVNDGLSSALMGALFSSLPRRVGAALVFVLSAAQGFAIASNIPSLYGKPDSHPFRFISSIFSIFDMVDAAGLYSWR